CKADRKPGCHTDRKPDHAAKGAGSSTYGGVLVHRTTEYNRIVNEQAIHFPTASAASVRASSIASPSFAGSLPPAWARLGLPPPLPPTALATSPTSLSACTPFLTRSSVAAATNCTLPSSTQPTTTTALPAFWRRRSTCCRICSCGPVGSSPTMILAPFTSV